MSMAKFRDFDERSKRRLSADEATDSASASLFAVFSRDPITILAGSFLVLVVLSGLFAPWIAPADPNTVTLGDRFIPPLGFEGASWQYPLGTDGLGRDILSRLMHGGRISLFIGIAVVIFTGAVGTLLGLVAGYLGGWWDTAIMRFADTLFAFPGLLMVIAVVAVIGPSISVLVGVLAVLFWIIFARFVRGNVLQIRESLYVKAAQHSGCSTSWIMRRHLMPALAGPVLGVAMLVLAQVVLAEASLSYLGLGVQPPDASWGLMISEYQADMATAWWAVTFPGLALTLTVLATNLLSKGMKDERGGTRVARPEGIVQ